MMQGNTVFGRAQNFLQADVCVSDIHELVS